MSEQTPRRDPWFYVGAYPALVISTYMPEDRPYRIAVGGQVVVGMGIPGASLTAMMVFDDLDLANTALDIVKAQLPDAEILILEGPHAR